MKTDQRRIESWITQIKIMEGQLKYEWDDNLFRRLESLKNRLEKKRRFLKRGW